VSDGVFQTEREYATGATQLGAKKFGARVKPYSLRTVLWQRSQAAAIDLFVEIVDGDRVYLIDTVAGTTLKSYVLPNARVPSKIDLITPQQIRFRTAGAAAGEDQSVAVTWAEEGTP
jgi:hypothetical protein